MTPQTPAPQTAIKHAWPFAPSAESSHATAAPEEPLTWPVAEESLPMGNPNSDTVYDAMRNSVETFAPTGPGWEGARDWIYKPVPPASVPLDPAPSDPATLSPSPSGTLIDTVVPETAPDTMYASVIDTTTAALDTTLSTGGALDQLLEPGILDVALKVLGTLGPIGAGVATVLGVGLLGWRLLRRTKPHFVGLTHAAVRGARKSAAAYRKTILDDSAAPGPSQGANRPPPLGG